MGQITQPRKTMEQEGIELLQKVWTHWGINGEHDQIWMYSMSNIAEDVPEEVQKKLVEIGWFLDEECWSCFV